MIPIREFIYEYIKKLNKEDINQFFLKENIMLENIELDYIYDYIKNKYDNIFINPEIVLRDAKNNLEYKTYEKILELYQKYNYLIK